MSPAISGGKGFPEMIQPEMGAKMKKNTLRRMAGLRGGMVLAIIALLSWAGYMAVAQTPVTLSPVARQQFFFGAGTPMASGCIFTYASGTSTPQATWTDQAGTSQAPNPIILDSGGFASIWLSSQAYRFVAFSAGGVNCASGAQQWLVDGINPGPFLAGNNAWTGNETHSGTETFGGAVTVNGTMTFTGQVIGLPGTGTVTSVILTTPSWLTVTGSPITTSGTLAVTPTVAQAAHQVIATCGAGSTFAPCLLVAGDLGTGSATSTTFLRGDLTWQPTATEATFTSGPLNVTFFNTTGIMSPKYVLSFAHTLTRIRAAMNGVMAGCAGTATVAVYDFTSSAIVSSISVGNGSADIDSGALSVAMTAGHVFGLNTTTATSGCSAATAFVGATYQ
jgi:hypothetical protein